MAAIGRCRCQGYTLGECRPRGVAAKDSMTATLDAFRSSLQRGSGRAMLILRNDPDNPDLLAALFHSCTVNEVFDWQCEPARAAYLRRLILATGQVDAFRRDLAAHLAGAGAREGGEGSEESGGGAAEPSPGDMRPEGMNSEDLGPKDLGQTFELLCLLAADEPSFDRRVLWDFLARTDFETARFGCADALVKLDGLPALLHCVERFPADLANAPYELDGLVFELRERDGEAAASEALAAARGTSAALDLVLSLTDGDDEDDMPDRQSDAPGDYRTIKAAFDDGRLTFFPVGWWRSATDEDLALAAADLLAETEDMRRLRYLRVFGRVDFPLDPEPLFGLLKSPVRQVRVATANTLGRLRRPSVRALALAAVAGGASSEWLGLRLLRSSAEPGDSALFGPFLAAATAAAADGAVHWGYSYILQIINDDRLPLEEGLPWLVRVYKETPCSNCRHKAVAQLTALGRLPDWIAAEWPFDLEAPPIVGVTA